MTGVKFTISKKIPVRLLYASADFFISGFSWITASGLASRSSVDFCFSALLTDSLLIAMVFTASGMAFSVYRIMWKLASVSDMFRLGLSAALSYALFSFYAVMTSRGSVAASLVISFFLTLNAAVFYRIILRYKLSRKNLSRESVFDEKKVLMVGAGEAGRTMLAEYDRLGLGGLITGFVDDDPAKIGGMLNGKIILGRTIDIPSIIRDISPTDIYITIPSVGSEIIRNIVSKIRAESRSIPIKILPPLVELFEKKPLAVSLRDLSLGDLIGRDEFDVDTDAVKKKFSGKTVLVTGAGGSIGSEICRQLMKLGVSRIIALGRGEFSIYNLIKNLGELSQFIESPPEIIYRVADVKDLRLIELIFRDTAPEIVFHAAAHKHVPLMESNEAEALQNNVGGTANVLEACVRCGIKEFVFISTDKAVNPTSVMGATKRIGEMIIQDFRHRHGLHTAIVRFGNVIGSRGSVIPLFMEQIESGGPVTITHPDVTRYFMSIPEAALLVLNAAAYSAGGELFVLDMGRQYRITEIAERLIELYGYRSDIDIKIEYTGMRPGEKLHEDLFYPDEPLDRTLNDKIFILNDNRRSDGAMIEKLLGYHLKRLASMESKEIRDIIKQIVPEYNEDKN